MRDDFWMLPFGVDICGGRLCSRERRGQEQAVGGEDQSLRKAEGGEAEGEVHSQGGEEVVVAEEDQIPQMEEVEQEAVV